MGLTSSTVGLFRTTSSTLAQFLAQRLGPEWWCQPFVPTRIGVFAEELSASREPYDHLKLLAELDGWTLMLTDGPAGTDLGVLPSLVARELGVPTVRASAVEACDRSLAGASFETFDPDASSGMRFGRWVSAIDDGSRWVFAESDIPPLSFEDVTAYSRRRIRDRLTSEMVRRYVRDFGVPEFDLDLELPGYLVRREPRPVS
jgi:hypothetical protein